MAPRVTSPPLSCTTGYQQCRRLCHRQNLIRSPNTKTASGRCRGKIFAEQRQRVGACALQYPAFLWGLRPRPCSPAGRQWQSRRAHNIIHGVAVRSTKVRPCPTSRVARACRSFAAFVSTGRSRPYSARCWLPQQGFSCCCHPPFPPTLCSQLYRSSRQNPAGPAAQHIPPAHGGNSVPRPFYTPSFLR